MPIVTGQISTVIYPRQEQQVSQESQESRQFWTEQGYPQYGGRYAPVEVPEGYRISRVVETETGLRVTFTKPYEKSFPIKETKKGMVLEPSQTAEVNKIVGIGRARQPSTKIYYFEPPSKEETEAYFERQEAYRKAIESGKLKFLPRYIHYTGYGHATSPYLPPYKPGLVNPVTGKPFASFKEWQKENARQYSYAVLLYKIKQSEYQASVKFWTEQGFPEFAGKYKVPTVPEGYELVVTKIPKLVSIEGVSSIAYELQLALKPSSETSSWKGWTEQEAYDILTSPKVSLTKQGEIIYQIPIERLSLEEQAKAYGYDLTEMVDVQKLLAPSTLGGFSVIETMTVEEALKQGYPLTPKGQMGIVEQHYLLAATELGLTAVLAPSIAKVQNILMEKLSETGVGKYLSYQFKQHAPEPLLKLVYGKELGSAISIERQWSWSEASVEGTGGMLEETYGMPFYRQQTLWQNVPTVEWSDVRQLEQLARSQVIERVWGWESKVFGMTGEILKPTREAFETSESLRMEMPIRREEKPWYIRTSGYPQTPMEVTLKRAMEQVMLAEGGGGLSSIQELILIRETITPPSPYTFPKEPTEGFAQFERQLAFEGAPQIVTSESKLLVFFGLPLIAMPTTRSIQMTQRITESIVKTENIGKLANILIPDIVTSIAEMQMVDQQPSLMAIQILRQTQSTRQLQALQQIMATPQVTVQKFKTDIDIKLPKIPETSFMETKPKQKTSKKKPSGKPYGFYVWEFPILDPEKVWKLK